MIRLPITMNIQPSAKKKKRKTTKPEMNEYTNMYLDLMLSKIKSQVTDSV